ncbi:MAG: hypothetical protein JO199_13805 [Candidatus Eremiobacteraeota bacterium]|nr:hypothetical protein [Candidatus Eremiobacteraeota bacterium]
MPLYDYRCTQCGHVSEVRHGFDQTHDAPCEACGGTLARVFNPAPIVFKGSGFYATDSRKPAASESSSSASSSEKSADKPSENKASDSAA